MPSLFTWFNGGGNTASGTTTLTSGTASALAYFNHTQPTATCTTNATSAMLYAQQQQNAASAPHWAALGSTSTAGSIFWVETSQGRWYTQEDLVTPEQYLALARRRVEYTEEQLRERERRMIEQQERNLREMEQRRAALARSRELLLQHLTRAQRRTFEENNWFIVQGGDSKKTYRIHTTGYTGNIDELDRSERATHRLCGHLRGAYALYDHHVAQKISLEYDEEAFVAICNRSALALYNRSAAA